MSVSEPVEEAYSKPQADLSILSKREREVLEFLCRGFTRAAVAKHLFRSPKTIDNHCTRIYHKLGVQSQAQLVSMVFRHGMITPQAVAPEAGVRTLRERIYEAVVPLERRLARSDPDRFFAELVSALADAVGTDMAGITEMDIAQQEATTVFSVDRGAQCECSVCPLDSSGCGRTFQLGEFSCDRGVTSVLPDSEMMRVEKIESYAGVRLDARVLGTVGCLWVADRKPIEDLVFVQDVLRLLRRRVSTEMAFQAMLDEGRRPQ